MRAPHWRPSGSPAGVHPVVLNRRLQDLFVLSAAALAVLVLSLGISVAVPKPNLLVALAVIAGAVGTFALVVYPRLEVTVAFLAIYLGCLNGPVKLISSAGVVSAALQDVVMLAVCLGVLVRLIVSRRSIRLPALSGWVIAFVLVVLVEAFNPKTHGALKVVAGFRQQLQWVPFFFFGYLLMRSKDSFRKAFLLLGVIALANGVVATLQTQLSPQQIASWGPGYRDRVEGPAARTYSSEGEGRVRPLGLGSDSGFGGGVGIIALPAALALLTTMRRHRWIALVFCLAAIVAAATSLGRLQLGGAVLTVFAFALLSITAGRRFGRSFAALLVLLAVAVPVGALFVSAVGSGVFSRYESLAPSSAASTATSYKQTALAQVPHEIVSAPFGFGLATAGAVSGFGGKVTELLEGHNVNSETQANFLVKELGVPGLVVWFGFLLWILVLAFTRLRDVKDPELQVDLIAVFSPLVAILFMSYDGPVSVSGTLGPYFWFAAGVAGYWLAGPGRAIARGCIGGRSLAQTGVVSGAG